MVLLGARGWAAPRHLNVFRMVFPHDDVVRLAHDTFDQEERALCVP